MSSKKRLFIAIGLPEEIRSKLAEIQKQLRRFAIDAKWVNPESIHLTLKFLGYVEESRIQELNQALNPISPHYSFCTIRVSRLGFFPNSRRPSVLWAGLIVPDVGPLQAEIDETMTNLGFEKENRAFTPHLTLARFREPKGLTSLVQQSEKFQNANIGEFIAQEFSLYESVLHPHGARYTILHSFPLAQK